MANTSGKPKGKITFLAKDEPALNPGVYGVTVSQNFSVDGTEHIKHSDTQKTLNVGVFGPRFAIEPGLIVGKFPPAKSVGAYHTVLPHMVLKRSTLPWERKISDDSSYQDAPWLALLLFTQAENIIPQTVAVETLVHSPAKKHWEFPNIALEPGQTATDRAVIIDVAGSLLKKILPAKAALPYLAHVRQSADAADATKHPIVVCNRLPQLGNETTVHLVSLEHRTDLFDHLDVTKTYRLVSLASWRFASIANPASFVELLEKAYTNHMDGATNEASNNVLRLSTLEENGNTSKTIINRFYRHGFVPLPHQTRQGNRIVSWLRSPLLPGSPVEKIDFHNLSVSASDQLVRYHADVGMFDMTYAAAWELGRLLMLRRKRISVAFYNWKRTVSQAMKTTTAPHLPLARLLGSQQFPSAVAAWFVGLGRLKDVPANYLVPDERLLPKESLRFFTVDPVWMAYLVDGAFSVGRVYTKDAKLNRRLRGAIPLPTKMSGFLLRSQVVAGWPHMQITGYAAIASALNDTHFMPQGVTSADILKPLRLERIAPDTLLCIFDGDLKMIDLAEKSEVIHFGVSYHATSGGAKNGCYYKILRDQNGNEYNVNPSQNKVCCDDPHGHWVTIPFRTPDKLVIDIMKLVQSHKNKNIPMLRGGQLKPNRFALEMIEGVQKMRLVMAKTNAD